MSTKKGTIKTVKPSGYTNKLSSDSWSYPDNQVVIDITGERITYGELKQRRASGYYDDWQSEAEKAAKRKSAAEKRYKCAQRGEQRKSQKHQWLPPSGRTQSSSTSPIRKSPISGRMPSCWLPVSCVVTAMLSGAIQAMALPVRA